MDKIEKKVEEIDRDISYFDKMVGGAEKLIRPWKTLAIVLAVAVVLSNAIWAGVHGYAIYKAYQEPTTYEYEQTQNQDGEIQNQEATGKGGGN